MACYLTEGHFPASLKDQAEMERLAPHKSAPLDGPNVEAKGGAKADQGAFWGAFSRIKNQAWSTATPIAS